MFMGKVDDLLKHLPVPEDIAGDPTKFLNAMASAIHHLEQARTDMMLGFEDLKDHDPMGDEIREIEPMASQLQEMHGKLALMVDAIKAHGSQT